MSGHGPGKTTADMKDGLKRKNNRKIFIFLMKSKENLTNISKNLISKTFQALMTENNLLDLTLESQVMIMKI